MPRCSCLGVQVGGGKRPACGRPISRAPRAFATARVAAEPGGGLRAKWLASRGRRRWAASAQAACQARTPACPLRVLRCARRCVVRLVDLERPCAPLMRRELVADARLRPSGPCCAAPPRARGGAGQQPGVKGAVVLNAGGARALCLRLATGCSRGCSAAL